MSKNHSESEALRICKISILDRSIDRSKRPLLEKPRGSFSLPSRSHLAREPGARKIKGCKRTEQRVDMVLLCRPGLRTRTHKSFFLHPRRLVY